MEELKTCTAWRNNIACLACDGRENSFFAGLQPDAIATLHVDVDNTATVSDKTLYRAGSRADSLWAAQAVDEGGHGSVHLGHGGDLA